MSDGKLELLRKQISLVNRQLLDDLNERLRLVNVIRELKLERGVPMYDPAREEHMLQELLAVNSGPLEERQIHEIFMAIFQASLSWAERRSREGLRVHRREGDPDRRIEARGHFIGGGGPPVLIAGPCSIEDEEQLSRVAGRLAQLGCHFLRGGAYKPRTSPYTFQGLGEEGWRLLRKVADPLGMAVVSEVVDPRHLDAIGELVDVVQVGARNMFNYELLKAVGQLGKPVLLKRSFMATLEELVLAAEYIAMQGNDKIILCERGIRSFERWTRNTLDVAAIPLLKQVTPLPVLADVAHAAGRRDILIPLARAALAAGADGIMVEVSPFPASASSDAEQQLDLDELSQFHAAVFGGASLQRQ